MYIKQIIIQGFKSYKDQTVIEPFSPKLNVIVGRNGSGKSNFFAAIRFVLSDAYTQMGREERQALLHEGSGSAVMSAYVEIIFDNADERFPTGKEELVLRRTIGLKKDEYSLDRKSATKADVMNLLESAGFSRANPYYIVPQGRVTTLTNMKDPERLNLLKEVAGTQVYETRRSESLKIMASTDQQREKIDDTLAFIRERLAELEAEKEELKAYQDKDRERRCLEYTIYNREKVEIDRALEQLDELRQTGVDETDDDRERFIQGEQEMAQIDNEIKELKQQIEFLKVDKLQLEDERRDIARDKAKTELQVKNLTEGQSAAQQARTRYQSDLQELQQQIQQREGELAGTLPEYNGKKEQENTVKSQLNDAEGVRQRLYAKQGRNAQFRTRRERDEWLRNQVEEINVALATRKAVTMQITEDIVQLETEIGQADNEVTEIRARIDNCGDETRTISTQVQQAKEERDRLMDQRKELWREEAKLDSVISNAQQELEKAERFLSHMMDQNTYRGLAAVRRIQRQQNLDGVYGTLAELFQVSDKYKTAVEVTAGTSLFYYVVDTDETASKLLEALQRDKAGRVTFMPLNRLRPRPANIPKASDAVHLLQKIEYDRAYEAAFEQVFGKTIVCPNLQVAAGYARSHGVSAITPEGDRADKRGALTGGFVDPRSSRIDAIRNVAKWRDEFETQKNRSQELRRAIEQKDQEITRAVGELQKIEQRRLQLENSYGPLRQELRDRSRELQNKRDALEAKQRSRANVESAVHDLGEQLSSYEAELGSDFAAALTPAEEQQLETLSAQVQDLRRRYAELSTERSDLEARKTTLELELRENLRPRLDQLTAQDVENGNNNGGGGGGNGSSTRLQERQHELSRATEALTAIEAKLQEAEDAIEAANTNLTAAEQRKSDKKKSQEVLAQAIEKHSKRMEKSMAKRALLMTKAADATLNIRELGVLPEDAFTKYQNIASDRAIRRLHKLKEQLKKYAGVNKKAFEQYNNFTRQRDVLQKRREGLDQGQESIRELIDVLDQRKDEAIERTFRQVSREFATVFEKLVPAGKGRLVIQRRTDRAARAPGEETEGEDSGAERREGVENYSGVGISVSFNSKHDEQQRIQQLSGLCALALVFAIQQCDPAPFYLFDEIDANLDAQYRTAVANMLQSISANGQFICTTFRPEMVLVADKCYGVSYSNKTSSIDVVSREDALNFVEGQRV
ncbi:Chromosome segregation protein sudA [Cryomyces minteri]|uniref:Structural maintenance of chromosomes protein n=1 Tax=Cryomyces minteri TaxID=331657 RepID=A0A4U0XWG5_9PEZI|nr:Chromosome segregation protein sudA [Cryomyces minteri]